MATRFEPAEAPAGVSYERVLHGLEEGTTSLFRSDLRVQAVGIGRYHDGYGFRAVRNSRIIAPASASVEIVQAVDDIPVTYVDAYNSIESLAKVPVRGPGGAGPPSVVLEQQQQSSLCCGLQIQNFDYDDREGHLRQNFMTIGTLGCFVQLDDGRVCLLTNNHVIAGENRGQPDDRILHPGDDSCRPANVIATLHSFVPLRPSPHSANLHSGNVIWNDVDAAVAIMSQGVIFNQEYLRHHDRAAQANGGRPPQITGVGIPQIGDDVFKVGRTTSLTRGTITMAATTVAGVKYEDGPCWFRDSFVIESYDGTTFSNYGDSGSVIVSEKTGEVVGLLYATNGTQTFCCPIETVLRELNCDLYMLGIDLP